MEKWLLDTSHNNFEAALENTRTILVDSLLTRGMIEVNANGR